MGNTQYVKVTEMSTIEMLTCAQKGRQVELLPRKNEMGNFFFFTLVKVFELQVRPRQSGFLRCLNVLGALRDGLFSITLGILHPVHFPDLQGSISETDILP